MRVKLGWVIVVVVVSACGGGGGGASSVAGIDPRLQQINIYESQRVRVLGDPGAGVVGMPATSGADMPTMGQVVYTGHATLGVEQPGGRLDLVGAASITVDFDLSSASGRIFDAFGTTSSGQVADYSGEILLSANQIAADTGFTYDGILTGGGQTLGFSGTANGSFLGGTGQALVVSDLEADVVSGSGLASGTLVVVTEAPPP